MANDDKKGKRDGEHDDEADAGLTPEERKFKGMFPETWERMQREKADRKEGRKSW